MKYKEALAWLYSLQRFGIKLGLENIQRLTAQLRTDLSGAKVVHVAGTNGKGSVCAMTDSMCRAAKYRTGLFISPHLVTFRERIRVNGEMISEDEVATGLTNIRNLVADWDPHPTFFEITTALALKYFSKAKSDVIVLETGLGGRLDATNAVQPDVSVITPIALDHEEWLGDSIEKIAAEKAGIIKARTPVVSAPQLPSAEKVIRARATEYDAPLQFVDQQYSHSPIGLRGEHQKLNASIAVAAIRAAKIEIDDAEISRGLANVEWPARFQCWDKRTVIDGAHNPAAAKVLAENWRQIFGYERATIILAVLSDKDLRGICDAIVPIADSFLLPKIRTERGVDPGELARVIAASTPSLPCSISPSIREALDIAREKPNPILLTGSLHFAGEALAFLQGQPAAFEECAQ
ncbi:MAG TPA: folylpolyglutamate synthase/dihydrofolate synthase family protein [Chthoniobacterales bacterium]|nr:folylpolyglutamate synthase/dihydrofolate synthase family protein [Chthoniobacterales bacterium]